MNKLIGAMVLLLGVTSAAFAGGASCDINKMSKALNCKDSHILQIASLDDEQLSMLCEEIADDTIAGGELKYTLLQECKGRLKGVNCDIAEEINKVIEMN